MTMSGGTQTKTRTNKKVDSRSISGLGAGNGERVGNADSRLDVQYGVSGYLGGRSEQGQDSKQAGRRE